jgi:hypothetical protein
MTQRGMRVLIFTDSRGQHKPAGCTHDIFAERLARHPRLDVDMFLCPMKWTTTLDFLEQFPPERLARYHHVILYSGIVEWSPRPAPSAYADLYDNQSPANTENLGLNTLDYSRKIVNNKKAMFDHVFGEKAMAAHLSRPFDTVYEGQPTINMYSLQMAEKSLIPRLAEIPNLLFINSNRFCSDWNGDYWKARPSNIRLTEAYSELFAGSLPRDRVIDLLDWDETDVKRFTCDNIHLSEAGSDMLYERIMHRLNGWPSRRAVVRAFQGTIPSLQSPRLTHDELFKTLTPEEQDQCRRTTLIIGARIRDGDEERIRNLRFLLRWLNKFYGSMFDILLVEQDDKPRLVQMMADLPAGVRHEFIYNPNDFNRGWAYNAAVAHFCPSADVVALMDTDVLTGDGFVDCVLACHRDCQAVSPYQNIYYTNAAEVSELLEETSYSGLRRPDAIRNPVTITGGVLIVKKSAFMAVNGFEQYVGYGCEDRALDVTLINRYGSDALFIAHESYVHLHHQPDKAARSNFDRIYGHLTGWYGCKYDPRIGPHDYIHKNCGHAPLAVTEVLAKSRRKAFADLALYRLGGRLLTSNGQPAMKHRVADNGAFLPGLHAELRAKNLERAIAICDSALDVYQDTPLQPLFIKKREEIKHIIINSWSSASGFPERTSETLVILGNGPSLKYVMGNPAYREILKRYDTFGLNAAYRAYDELNFWPTYHGCLDMIVVESHLESYRAILPKLRKMYLLSEDHLGNDIIGFDHLNLTRIRFDPKFRDSNEKVLSTDFAAFRNWQNSGCNCVQIGLMLGYERVVLLGMDANYKELLTEADVVRDEKYHWDHLQITKNVKANDNYWFSGYQQVGDKYNIPNADKYHLPAWNALGLSEHRGRIVNCTTETKITTIARRSFEEIFGVVPSYRVLGEENQLTALNPDVDNLIGRIVKIGVHFFLMAEHDGKAVRKFVSARAFNDLFDRASGLRVLVCDESVLQIPCHGVVDDLSGYDPDGLKPGLTFMVRAKNERPNIFFVLGSLKHVLGNPQLRCQLLFVDNQSTDGTSEEVLRVCKQQSIRNVFLTSYQMKVCPSGDAHMRLQGVERARSLDTYYNWCLDRVMTHYVMKWDCDFLALQSNLIELIRRFELSTSIKPLAVWCAGKTLFKNGADRFVNELTMYNEFRVFAKAHGYRWEYAPRWEICSREYMARADKEVFSPCVFLELKDLARNEFEFRSQGTAIVSDVRDKRDGEIIASIKASNLDSLRPGLVKLDFDPLVPAWFNSPALNAYEASLEELDAMQSYWLNVYSRPDSPRRFEYKGNAIVQGLWVGEAISNLHRMCVESFLKNGHCFVLYTYGPVKNLPEGVVVKDANKIVPASLIYQYDGSYAGFSDLFRNKLLFANGGWYVDLDIFCLKRFDVPSEVVFSMDHYHPDTIEIKKGGGEIIDDRYYVQTNPCKLPAGHDIARSMYSAIFKKIVFERLKAAWVGERTEQVADTYLRVGVPSELVIGAIEKLRVRSDFEAFVGPLSLLQGDVSFQKVLDTFNVALSAVGQKTWGEIGPIMITREVVSRGLQQYATKPEQFQGVVKYFEVEKFLDPGFDYTSSLDDAGSYSIDLFYTMWRRRGLLDRFDTDQRCLISHLRNLVSNPTVERLV